MAGEPVWVEQENGCRWRMWCANTQPETYLNFIVRQEHDWLLVRNEIASVESTYDVAVAGPFPTLDAAKAAWLVLFPRSK